MYINIYVYKSAKRVDQHTIYHADIFKDIFKLLMAYISIYLPVAYIFYVHKYI